MKCPKCKSFDVEFNEHKEPIIYSCNSCGHQWQNNSNKFEEFLQERFYKEEYKGEGGDIGIAFEEWLTELNIDQWLNYGEWFANKTAKEILEKRIKELKAEAL